MKSQFDTIGQIIAYESGELDQDGVIELFRHLIDTGMINDLQGHYGRTAAQIQKAGYL